MLEYEILIYPFFFNDTATSEIYTLSLHDALPIYLQILALRVRNRLAVQLRQRHAHKLLHQITRPSPDQPELTLFRRPVKLTFRLPADSHSPECERDVLQFRIDLRLHPNPRFQRRA